jgi:hypothetical protein
MKKERKKKEKKERKGFCALTKTYSNPTDTDVVSISDDVITQT